MHNIFHVTWRVTPLEPPSLWRNCRSCGTAAPFRSSGRFRTNAQKKRIDIWLIYNCRICDETWNLPILDRIAIGDLAPSQFEAIARNDPDAAESYAFDAIRLSRHGRVEDCGEADVVWIAAPQRHTDIAEIAISIHLTKPWRARLERLVATQLGISRNRLRALREADLLALEPPNRDGLRGPVCDNQRIRLRRGTNGMDFDLAAIIRNTGRAP